MKRIANPFFIALIIALLSCNKETTESKVEGTTGRAALVGSQLGLYEQLKNSLDFTWIRENPELVATQPSYFDKEKATKYIVAPIQISGFSIPFTWDDDLSILKFLQAKNPDMSVLRGVEADSIYKGINASWGKTEYGLLWIDGEIYKAPIKSWQLFEENDCPGTIMFPTLSFEKQFDVPNARTNNLAGIAIIPFNDEVKDITFSKAVIKTVSGQELGGMGYDINQDKINDVFIYSEDLEEEDGYTRLYLNVDGAWICAYVRLDELCV